MLCAGFFSQFGKVTKVRVSRNKKTGKAKHYAFLEFQLADVAAIAAEAMDGYMMFTQKLVVRVVPTKVHVKGHMQWKSLEETKLQPGVRDGGQNVFMNGFMIEYHTAKCLASAAVC